VTTTTSPLLARPGLDFGLPTDHGAAMCEFYQSELGLQLIQRDEIIEGHEEIFYQLHGSWLKINASSTPLEPAVTGYRRLIVADTAAQRPRTLHDPDGLAVTVVPAGHEGVDEVGLVLEVNDVEAQRRFIVEGMGGRPVGDGYRVGNTVLFLEGSAKPVDVTPIIRRGLTMLTLVVNDLLATHAQLVDSGGAHGLRPSIDPAFPERCVFSFVRDPTGNWIELVQFAEAPGGLPSLAGSNPSFDEFTAFRDDGTPV
jgi:catechol 2,3-dioxygenase-like lactoylglutathione lyase family enzyme